MAARDFQHSEQSTPDSEPFPCLSKSALEERLDEEINRAERHGIALSCLLVVIENLEKLARTHGRELSEQTLAHAGRALQRELRRFDRVGKLSESELLVVLPGADGTRGEVVARRALGRLRAIKIEVDGVRKPLRISVGIAAWREGLCREDLLAQARAAAMLGRGGEESDVGPYEHSTPPALGD
jgi:diguanylate cyclase (GGDEF)-like protein